MKIRISLVFLVVGLLLLSGCVKKIETPPYMVSGRIIDPDGNGLSNVSISYSGSTNMVVTDSEGKWSISNLLGAVTITPTKQGWLFQPARLTVSHAATDINYTAITATPEALVKATVQSFFDAYSAYDVAAIPAMVTNQFWFYLNGMGKTLPSFTEMLSTYRTRADNVTFNYELQNEQVVVNDTSATVTASAWQIYGYDLIDHDSTNYAMDRREQKTLWRVTLELRKDGTTWKIDTCTLQTDPIVTNNPPNLRLQITAPSSPRYTGDSVFIEERVVNSGGSGYFKAEVTYNPKYGNFIGYSGPISRNGYWLEKGQITLTQRGAHSFRYRLWYSPKSLPWNDTSWTLVDTKTINFYVN